MMLWHVSKQSSHERVWIGSWLSNSTALNLISYNIISYNVHNQRTFLWQGGFGLAEAMKIYCSSTNLTVGDYKCHKGTKIQLVDPSSFFPIHRRYMVSLYANSYEDIDLNIMQKSYLAHIYGANWALPVPVTSLYASLARHYCPLTWKAAQDYNVDF